MTPQERRSTSDLAWGPGPRHPRLARGALHVWRADLVTVSDDVLNALSPEEHARADRILGERKRRLWARSRGVLRDLLGRYLDSDPGDVRIVVCEHGKPALVGTAGNPRDPQSKSAASDRTYFNLSHSRGLALYAFAEAGPVGVDVEVTRQRGNEVAIAKRVLGRATARDLEAAHHSAGRAFLRAWTRHEAELKCAGSGISPPGMSDREPPSVWSLGLEMGPRAMGSVAAAAVPCDLLCCDWNDPSDHILSKL
jgi:4'-phosphopantetheinyl transferase